MTLLAHLGNLQNVSVNVQNNDDDSHGIKGGEE